MAIGLCLYTDAVGSQSVSQPISQAINQLKTPASSLVDLAI